MDLLENRLPLLMLRRKSLNWVTWIGVCAAPSSKSPNEVGSPRELNPISSHWEDLPSLEDTNSYDVHTSVSLKRVTTPVQPISVQQLLPPSYAGVAPSHQGSYGASGCSCAAPPALPCCAPVQPCCLPSLPCCPPPPCCPRIPVCCLPPPPCCLPQPVCCPVVATPPCFRACPTCPCRRRLHHTLRMKRSPGIMMGDGTCTKCAAGDQRKRARIKRQSNCRECSNNSIASMFTQPSSTCNACAEVIGVRDVSRASYERKETSSIKIIIELKDLVVYHVLGGKKRSPNNCRQCSNLGDVLQRFKRSFLCSPCGRKKRETKTSDKPEPTCSCAQKRSEVFSYARKKRKVDNIRDTRETCDKSCCDYSRCPRDNARKNRASANFRS
ncbi:hypothetical protein KIN20_002465 [Parelaphostrongylus tenuis]|uniref:Uncharacterized protein n=1 Tax=Parelaphostrongylus tenuis TaxID=148309 RepID=A0AAD5QD12_PARTN|nr:hypothetical protein KIN20_002465 [Parelaphostrongylus tenuis]